MTQTNQVDGLQEMVDEARPFGSSVTEVVRVLYTAACDQKKVETGSLRQVEEPDYSRLMGERIAYAQERCREYIGRMQK